MFEKKKKKLTLLDKLPSSYTDVSDDTKKWGLANRLYSLKSDKMFRFNISTGVFSDLETDELVGVTTTSLIKPELFAQTIRLFIDSSDKHQESRLPESLIVKHKDKEETDGDV